MVFVALVSLGLTLSPPSSSQSLARPPAVRRHASVTSLALGAEPAIRIGHGYDIHRMASREEAGQPLVIAGVKFDGSDAPDFELGCVAHSDGDVIYHSVVPRSPLEPAHARDPAHCDARATLRSCAQHSIATPVTRASPSPSPNLWRARTRHRWTRSWVR